MPSCGDPEKSAGLRFSLIFPTAAPTNAPFICHRQRSRVLPGTRVPRFKNFTHRQKNTGTAKAMPVFLAGAEGLGVCCGVALHTDGSATEILRISVPASPLFAKNSSPNCFLNAQTLSGSSPPIFLTKIKKSRNLRLFLILAGAEGLEPSARGFGVGRGL